MLISLAILIVIVYCGVGALLYFMQPKMLYYPEREIITTPEDRGYDYENIFFMTADGVKLNGWYVPADNDANRNSLTVLFCHGNGGNIGYYLETINIFHKTGVNCFVFDYRGYGLSEGRPSEKGTYEDALAAYRWLINQKKLELNNIVINGWSLGGSVAAELAAEVPAAGLWLESAFTSYADMAAYHYPFFPVRWFCRYKYNTLEYLKQVRCPVMIIHSPEDEIVPFKMGRALYEAAAEPKKFVQTCGAHNEAFTSSEGHYVKEIMQWLEDIKTRPNSPTAPTD